MISINVFIFNEHSNTAARVDHFFFDRTVDFIVEDLSGRRCFFFDFRLNFARRLSSTESYLIYQYSVIVP